MAKAPKDPKTQIFLILELATGEPSIEQLQPLFNSALMPSLLLVPDKRRTPDKASLEALIAVAQHAGVAVLIADDVDLATSVGADGVHLTNDDTESSPLERYLKTREALGANGIVGADAGASRHNAMALGEAGADYVAFGELEADNSPVISDHDPEPPTETQHEIIAWWTEIFEIPVVALDIDNNETAKHFADIGTDFVARKVPTGLSTADLRDWLQSAHAAITRDQSVG